MKAFAGFLKKPPHRPGVNPDGIQHPEVGQLPPVAEPVNGCRTDPQEPGRRADREQWTDRTADFTIRRHSVQQGSSKPSRP